jgi:hypothetical protein
MIVAVLRAIDLDDEFIRDAGEITNRGSDNDLAAEVRSFKRQGVSQMPPQSLFRLGHRASHATRVSVENGRRRLSHAFSTIAGAFAPPL